MWTFKWRYDLQYLMTLKGQTQGCLSKIVPSSPIKDGNGPRM